MKICERVDYVLCLFLFVFGLKKEKRPGVVLVWASFLSLVGRLGEQTLFASSRSFDQQEVPLHRVH